MRVSSSKCSRTARTTDSGISAAPALFRCTRSEHGGVSALSLSISMGAHARPRRGVRHCRKITRHGPRVSRSGFLGAAARARIAPETRAPRGIDEEKGLRSLAFVAIAAACLGLDTVRADEITVAVAANFARPMAALVERFEAETGH